MRNQSNFGVRQQSLRYVASSTNQTISNYFATHISSTTLGNLAYYLSVGPAIAFTSATEVVNRGVVACKRFYHARHLPEDAQQLLTQMQTPEIKEKATKNLGCALENKTMQIDGSAKNNQEALKSINYAKKNSDEDLQSIKTTDDIKRLFGTTQILADLDGRINLELIVDGKIIAITNKTGNTDGQYDEIKQYNRNDNLQCLIDNVDTIATQTGISKENIWRAIFMIPGQSLAGSFNALLPAGIEDDGYSTNPDNTTSTLTLSFESNCNMRATYQTTGTIIHAHTDGEGNGLPKSVSDNLPMAVIETAVLTLNTKDDKLEYKPAYGESKMSFHAADIDEKGNITKLHRTPLLEIQATQAPEVKQTTSESIIEDLRNAKQQISQLESQYITNANKIIDLVIDALEKGESNVVIPEDINIPSFFTHTNRTLSIVDAVELAQNFISKYKTELQRQKDINSNTLTSTVLAFGAIIATIKEFQQQNDLS